MRGRAGTLGATLVMSTKSARTGPLPAAGAGFTPGPDKGAAERVVARGASVALACMLTNASPTPPAASPASRTNALRRLRLRLCPRFMVVLPFVCQV